MKKRGREYEKRAARVRKARRTLSNPDSSPGALYFAAGVVNEEDYRQYAAAWVRQWCKRYGLK